MEHESYIFWQLKQLGHSVDKVEFIVMGGTFMSLADEYRDYFIRNLHDALSGHTSSCVDEAVKYEKTPKYFYPLEENIALYIMDYSVSVEMLISSWDIISTWDMYNYTV